MASGRMMLSEIHRERHLGQRPECVLACSTSSPSLHTTVSLIIRPTRLVRRASGQPACRARRPQQPYACLRPLPPSVVCSQSANVRSVTRPHRQTGHSRPISARPGLVAAKFVFRPHRQPCHVGTSSRRISTFVSPTIIYRYRSVCPSPGYAPSSNVLDSSVSSAKARSQSGRGKTRRGCVSQALRLAPKLTTNAAPSLVSVFCVSCTGSTKYLRHRVGRGTFGLVDGRIVRFLCSAPRWTCARNRRVYGDLLSTSHQHRPSVTPILGWRTSSIWVAHTSRANHYPGYLCRP